LIDLALLAVGGAGYSALIEPGWLRVETVPLKLRRLSQALSGIRIALISDIHMGGWMTAERLQHVADVVLEQRPDILLITGDFVTGHGFTESKQQALKNMADVLTPLASTIPSFAVLGNHDYWSSEQAVREMLSACGITDLTNTVFPWTREGENLYLCGVDDVWAGEARLDDVAAQLEDESAAILLVHEPDYADTSAATGRFDLQVSGHSHGGQVVIPFLGPPILPHLGRKYPAGLYKVGNMYQYTNRGVGMLSPPVRFNCRPEITLFILESID
jgi:predicted MPP superfamily phosphohydrolase